MRFKKTLISISAGLALIVSGQSFALDPTNTPQVTVNISGASAQQKTLGALLASFCTDGSLATYLDDPEVVGASKGKKWRSYFCKMKSAAPVPDTLFGQKVLFNNRSKGGSIWGVVPVGRVWDVEYLNVFRTGTNYLGSFDCSLNSTDVDGNQTFHCGWGTAGDRPSDLSVAGECKTPAEGVTTDTTNKVTDCLKSHGGVSDVEPQMFIADNVPASFSGGSLDSTESAKLAVASEYGVIFGISVTHDVYEDLQVAQGLSAVLDLVDPAKRPSMTKRAIASILRGTFKDWRLVDQTAHGRTGAKAGGGFGIMGVCRRGNGSGTQAAQNAFFMENPCRQGGLGGSLSMATKINTGAYVVVENSSSGDVIDCQNDAFNGVAPFVVTTGAIGFNAIEKQPGAADKWAFISIDGVAPTVANAISGAYPHWFEQTIQWVKPTASGPFDGQVIPQPLADGVNDTEELAALTMVRDASGNPTIINSVPLNGVAALSTNGHTWDDPLDFPTMRGFRGNNSCSPILLSDDNP